MELYLPPVSKKRQSRPTIKWSDSMIRLLKDEYPVRFNKELASELGIGWRSLVRKARELGIEKEAGFLESRREIITQLAVKNNHNPNTGRKGWSVPGGEDHRFKPGRISLMAIDRNLVERVRSSRNETIRKERIRINLGLRQKTKLRLLG